MPGLGLLEILASALEEIPSAPIAIAVSGGGDSLALLHLADDLARQRGLVLRVVTVDHGLRPESGDEAREVGEIALNLGLEHSVLRWQGWDHSGNLQDQARRARYQLMAEWAKSQGIAAVLLGHTMEDQAETLLMRLGRGSGVFGLSAMAAQIKKHDVLFMRPLLRARRQDLRDYLRDLGVDWLEDPSNQDLKYDRVKARALLPKLAEIGADPVALFQVAENLSQARDALNWAASQFAQDHVSQAGGELRIEATAFAGLPDALARRVLVAALNWTTCAEYGPRGSDLSRFLQAAKSGRAVTLQGGQMGHRKGNLTLFREYNAVQSLRVPLSEAWDQRWRFQCENAPQGSEIAALGRVGLAQCPDWRESGRTAASVMADPAVWHAGVVFCAPTARSDAKNQVILHAGNEVFANRLLSR